MSDDSDGHWQCRRRGANVQQALADMAGVGPDQQQRPKQQEREEDEEDLASTRLSLELGKVGIQPSSSPCSSAAHGHHSAQQQQPLMPVSSGYGPRPRHVLTEAEKEAKRLRRVLANRESARQTILRRQAIRDDLARKVADLSSQNESMKKEKDMVMQEYLSLKEANKQLKRQVARTTKKAAATTAPVSTAMHMQVAVPQSQQAAAEAAVLSAAASTPPQPSFLYSAAPPAGPVPYVWGYEHAAHGSPPAPARLCLPPCAWYYPAVVAEPTSAGGGTAEEDTDDDPCSLTLAIDVVYKRTAPIAVGSSRATAEAEQQVGTERDKAATAAEARKKRKELTKLKHVHAAACPGGEQW